ncbi:hypothetical protein ACFOFO_05325 [Undibacterium arcticum]|uniref:Uncharacterized protein n=1 Tax=Undibacterium arcticum TaxID=1762892 RepID=A0ABV7EZP9_9BURK
MNEVIIKNEKDAFDLLQKALDQQLGDKAFTLKFDHWPLIEIKLEGDGYDSTITPDMAGALVEIQHAINRTYARTVHHSTNARSLTAEERQDLQFKAKVESGSSLITVDLGKFAEKLATSVADKMTPELLAITIVGVAVAGASLLAYKAYLKNRSEDKVIEQKALTKMALSQEETKRLEIFARALKHTPELAHAQADFDDARNEIVRATGDAKSLTVNSVEMDNATAKVIGITKRSEAQEVQLNGTYLITATDLRHPNEIKLRIKRVSDSKEFMASFLDHSLQQDQIKMLQSAEWDRQPVYLSINAHSLRGEITTATVISVQLQPEAA